MKMMEMRVQIAKDVLRLMRPKRTDRVDNTPVLDVVQGGYFTVVGEVSAKPEDELRDVMRKKTCEVCALGALFAADIWRNDDLKLRSIGYSYADVDGVDLDRSGVTKRLEKYFSSDDLSRIETWFEASILRRSNDGQLDFRIREAAWKHVGVSSRLEQGSDRLRALLNHVIRNKGKLNWDKFLQEVAL